MILISPCTYGRIELGFVCSKSLRYNDYPYRSVLLRSVVAEHHFIGGKDGAESEEDDSGDQAEI